MYLLDTDLYVKLTQLIDSWSSVEINDAVTRAKSELVMPLATLRGLTVDSGQAAILLPEIVPLEDLRQQNVQTGLSVAQDVTGASSNYGESTPMVSVIV